MQTIEYQFKVKIQAKVSNEIEFVRYMEDRLNKAIQEAKEDWNISQHLVVES